MSSKIALNDDMQVLVALQSLVILPLVIFARSNFPGAILANAAVFAKICMWIGNVLPMEIYRHDRENVCDTHLSPHEANLNYLTTSMQSLVILQYGTAKQQNM